MKKNCNEVHQYSVYNSMFFFFDKENILIPKKISITPSLCNNIISRSSLDIKDAHSLKKEEKKDPAKITRDTARSPLVVTTRLRPRYSKTTPPER
jgi:hypothetical protein